MKRNRLVYALPLAGCLAAAAVASGSAIADTRSGDPYAKFDRYGVNPAPVREWESSGSTQTLALNDAAITANVRSALLADQYLSSSQIGVQTTGGVVQLSGFLGSQDEVDRAVSIAQNADGVRAVESRIQTR